MRCGKQHLTRLRGASMMEYSRRSTNSSGELEESTMSWKTVTKFSFILMAIGLAANFSDIKRYIRISMM
jgi:hypothetical protein